MVDKQIENTPTYRRMWENKGHRPYWAMLHINYFVTPFAELTGFSYHHPIFVINKNASNAAYWPIDEMEKATVYFRKWWEDDDNVKHFQKIQKERFTLAEKYVKKCFETKWKEISDDEIIALFKEGEKIHVFTIVFVTNPQHIQPLEEKLRAMLQGVENVEKVIASIATPKLPLPFDEEQKAIAQYREKWNSLSPKEKKDALTHLVSKFGWFAGVEGEHENDEAHYEREIRSTPPSHKEMPPANVSAEVRELGNLIGVLSNDRIWARYWQMSVRYCIKLGVMELSRRWNQPLLEYATLPEIYNQFFGQKINVKALQERKENGYVVTMIEDIPVLFTGEGAKQYIEKVKETISTEAKVIGRCANPGVVQGRVRIISFASETYHDEVNRFQKGEILVTGMTRPQIAHLCGKASAIITDEGGITSHAAIISRELNIPCLIATHSATKVFKTGDMIELDAEKGIAKRI